MHCKQVRKIPPYTRTPTSLSPTVKSWSCTISPVNLEVTQEIPKSEHMVLILSGHPKLKNSHAFAFARLLIWLS